MNNQPDKRKANIRRLTCCCCGEQVHGRQWWNRDDGYGVCVRCATAEPLEETRERLYGRRGEHWGLE